jgi:hypothetical protein
MLLTKKRFPKALIFIFLKAWKQHFGHNPQCCTEIRAAINKQLVCLQRNLKNIHVLIARTGAIPATFLPDFGKTKIRFASLF